MVLGGTGRHWEALGGILEATFRGEYSQTEMDGQEGDLLGAKSSPEKGTAIKAVAFYIQAAVTLEDSHITSAGWPSKTGSLSCENWVGRVDLNIIDIEANKPPGPTSLCLFSTRATNMPHHIQLLAWMLGIRTQVPKLAQQAPFLLSHLPS